jgi:uncharacterized protein
MDFLLVYHVNRFPQTPFFKRDIRRKVGYTAGIMLRFFRTLLPFILFIFLIPTSAFSLTLPSPTGYVTDPSHVLSEQQQKSLHRLSRELEQKTGIQAATLILADGEDTPVEDLAQTVFSTWKIGKKSKDNGVLFLVVLKQKKVRIHVGYGLEGDLNDGKAGELLDQAVLPYFKKGDIQTGVISGHVALAKTLAKAKGVELTGVPKQQYSNRSSIPEWVQFLMLIGLILFLWKGRGWVFLPLIFLGGAFGGGGRGRDDSDSFGGFGGGDSGGGGSSRDW